MGGHFSLRVVEPITPTRPMISAAVSEAELLAAAAHLPTAPRLLVELGQLLHHPRTDVDDIAGLLKQDPALIGQILRMVNSVAYSPAERIGSLEQALALVGFAEVHRLVGAIASRQLADVTLRFYPLDGVKLRLNTLFVAVLMEELAKYAGESPRQCYTIGLLRPIGMLALDRLNPPPSGLVPFGDSGESRLDVWERHHWGLANVDAAATILTHWKLPHETALAIRHHYAPEGKHNPLIHMLLLAATAASDRDFTIPGEQDYWKPRPDTLTRAGLGPNRFRMASERAQRKYEQLRIAIG